MDGGIDMSAFLRGALFGAGLVSAFLAGYMLGNPPSFRSESTQPTVQQAAKPTLPVPAKTTTGKLVVPPSIQLVSNSNEEHTLKIDFEKLTTSIPDSQADPDPNDLTFQIIRKQLGHKTTILGEPEPVPAVLVDAKKSGAPLHGMNPIPLMGPTPRLAAATPPEPVVSLPELPPPPVIDVPKIRESKQRRLVNRRDVELDFEVSKAGLSQIASTELWVTHEGNKWKKHDSRPGAKSPYQAKLNEDGYYGFRLVLVSETGQRSAEPRMGQVVDFELWLDTLPPKVKIFSPEAIQDASDRIKIRWQSTDKNPSAEGVKLDYSVDGETWIAIHPTPLSGNSFDWTLPKGIAPEVFIKITAKDAAGNVAVATSASKTAVDLVIPEGKITGIRDENAKPEVGPKPREVEQQSSIPRSFELSMMS